MTWTTGSIVESEATVSLFTIIFAVALAVIRLLQAPAPTPQSQPRFGAI
jgi:hypothetical protein